MGLGSGLSSEFQMGSGACGLGFEFGLGLEFKLILDLGRGWSYPNFNGVSPGTGSEHLVFCGSNGNPEHQLAI